MKRINKEGDSLIKKVEIKVFPPNKRRKLLAYRAANGKAYNSKHVDAILEIVTKQVEKNYPGITFRLIETGIGKFNIVHEPVKNED